MIRFAIVWIALAVPASAFAYEARLEINRELDLDQLGRSGAINILTERNGAVFSSDASAVLSRVDFAKLEAASADFDHYAEMGMPHVQESKIVSRAGDVLYTWTNMNTAGQTSMHYEEVKLLHGLNAQGAAGAEWELHHREAGWPFNESTAFTRLDGSWYMESLPNGRIYVRYFMAATFETSVPAFIVNWVAKRQFSEGVRQVIQTLARVATVQ